MYKCIRTYACACMHTCVRVCACVRTCMHACVCACMHAWVYEHLAACTRMHTSVFMHACMHILQRRPSPPPQGLASLALRQPPIPNIEKLSTPMIQSRPGSK